MKTFINRVAPIVVLTSMVAASQASTLYTQAFDGTGNAYSSQNDTSSLGNFATMYDNFTLGATASINEIEWTGEYFNPPSAGSITAWTINFYADSVGQPGTLMQTVNVGGNGSETFLGSFAGFPTYTYDVTGFSFAAIGGTQYWVSVVPDLTFPPQWGWSSGTGGDGSSIQDFQGNRGSVGADMAFSLKGNQRVLTPEPITMSLGLAGIGAFLRRRKARQS